MIIEKSLKITIKQADVELAIKELIKKEDPTIVVDTISFQPKRAGTDSIGITVGAHFADEMVEDEVSDEPEPEASGGVGNEGGDGTSTPEEDAAEVSGDIPPPFETDEVEEEISPKKGLFS